MRMPSGLGTNGKRFWKKVLTEFQLVDSHDLERLSMCAKCLDVIHEAETRLSVDGLFVENRYGTSTEHPGCKMVRDNKLLFVKIIRELGLDLNTAEPSRPPRQY